MALVLEWWYLGVRNEEMITKDIFIGISSDNISGVTKNVFFFF